MTSRNADPDLAEILAALSADEADEQTYKLLSATHEEAPIGMPANPKSLIAPTRLHDQ